MHRGEIFNFRLNYYSFLEGGFGGLAGYYDFTQTGIHSISIPKNIRINGSTGTKGSDARTCKTYAKEVTARSKEHFYLAVVVPMYTLYTSYYSNDIIDPNCPSVYVETDEKIESRWPSKHLNKPTAIDEYKTILLESKENPVFSKIVQNALDAINSVL